MSRQSLGLGLFEAGGSALFLLGWVPQRGQSVECLMVTQPLYEALVLCSPPYGPTHSAFEGLHGFLIQSLPSSRRLLLVVFVIFTRIMSLPCPSFHFGVIFSKTSCLPQLMSFVYHFCKRDGISAILAAVAALTERLSGSVVYIY